MGYSGQKYEMEFSNFEEERSLPKRSVLLTSMVMVSILVLLSTDPVGCVVPVSTVQLIVFSLKYHSIYFQTHITCACFRS